MQVRAIARAAVAVRERTGRAPHLEIMIPLVDYERELELVRDRLLTVTEEEGLTYGTDFSVGTMIELPRACFIADRIARHADFFSFGTNDLTQCGLGFSRDDIEGRIIPRYIEEKIVDVVAIRDDRQAGRRGAGEARRGEEDVLSARTSSLACAVSTVGIRSPSASSTTRGSTT